MNYDKFRDELEEIIDDNLEIDSDYDEQGHYSQAYITDKGMKELMILIFQNLRVKSK